MLLCYGGEEITPVQSGEGKGEGGSVPDTILYRRAEESASSSTGARGGKKETSSPGSSFDSTVVIKEKGGKKGMLHQFAHTKKKKKEREGGRPATLARLFFPQPFLKKKNSSRHALCFEYITITFTTEKNGEGTGLRKEVLPNLELTQERKKGKKKKEGGKREKLCRVVLQRHCD